MRTKNAHHHFARLATLAALVIAWSYQSLAAPPGVAAATPKQTPKKRSSYVPPSSELFKKISPAVVKVTIKYHGVPIATGSGFFATQNGQLVTSRQLMRPVFADPAINAEFTTTDKKTITEYKVEHCTGNSSDLCLLRLAMNSKVHFSFSTEPPDQGDGASLIGHPRGLDFTLTRGTVGAVPAPGGPAKGFEVQASASVGFQGSPVFDDHGYLIGVATRFDSKTQSLLNAAPVRDVEDLIGSGKEPISLSEARRFTMENFRNEIRKHALNDLDPALAFAMRSKPLDGLKGFKEVSLKFDEKTLRLTLPEAFDGCGFTEKARESTLHVCKAFDGAAVLSVQRMPSRGHEELLAKNGKRVVEPKPLALVEELTRTEEWEQYEKALKPGQKRFFASEPSQAQCQLVRTNKLPNAAFSNVPACRFSIANDSEPGGHSINIWILKDQYLYSLALWMNDTALLEYATRVPIIAALSARWEKTEKIALPRGLASTLSGRALTNYKVVLPDAVSFMGAKPASRGGQIDLYGKKLLLDKFEDGYFIAVGNQKKSYLPPDFDDVVKAAANEITKLLSTKIQASTLEVEPTTISGRPGRLLTAFGKDKQGRDVLVLSSTVFYDDQTFEITQISLAKDPSETFRDFKAFLAGFKRN